MSGMLIFCAAFGSFHVKSSSTSLMIVLVTVRVLPFFLTFTLMRSGTLIVSSFGTLSYSDPRHRSGGQGGVHDRRMSGDTLIPECDCPRGLDGRLLAGGRCCQTPRDRRSGILDGGRIEGEEPGSDPSRENERSA